MYGEPKAVFTDVIIGTPDGGWVIVPEPVKLNVLPSAFKVRFAAREPVAPRKMPVPPVIVEGRLTEEILKTLGKTNEALKLSFALKTNVSMP
jgi:hypothetical protein